jgi:hypothetical protein
MSQDVAPVDAQELSVILLTAGAGVLTLCAAAVGQNEYTYDLIAPWAIVALLCVIGGAVLRVMTRP